MLEANAEVGNERKMIRGDEGISCFGKMHVSYVDPAFIKNMVEMQQGQKSRIGPATFDKGANVQALKSWGQDIGGDTTPPFIEITENNFRTGPSMLVQNHRQSFCLIFSLPQSRAHMHVVNM